MTDLRFKIKDLSMLSKVFVVLILTTFSLQLSTVPTEAQTPTPSLTKTPTPAPTKTAAESQINSLKDRIASRVAQLKLVERRGIIGKVTKVSQTQITINDLKDETRFIDVDELTKFASPSASESFGISDIKEGSTLGVLGLYNKQSRRLLSRFIDVMSLPTTLHGAVSSVDDEEFVVEVTTENGTATLVDIENITKTTSYDLEADGTKSGFSKIKEDMRIMIVGFPSKTDKTRLIASRVLLFPDIPKNPKIRLNVTPSPTEDDTPATKSAR